LLIALFLLFTNPLSSQVLARAAHHRAKNRNKPMIVDQYGKDLGDSQ